MKQLKEWTRRLSVRKKTVTGVSALMAIVLVVGCTACSSNKETQEQKNVSVAKEDTKKEKPEKSLKDFIDVEDIYVRVNSKNVDLKKAVEVKKEQADIIDKIEVDTSKVDYTKTGTYDVVYTVTLKPDVAEAGAEKEKAENKTDTDSKDTVEKSEDKNTANQTDADSKNTENENTKESKDSPTKTEQEVITGSGKVEVVTEEKAKELAQAGKDVLISDNQMMAKEDKKEEKKEEAKKEDAKKEENKTTAKADSNVSSNSNNNSSGSNAPTSSHTHNWVAQYTTVDDYQTVTDYVDQPIYENQPIYETRPVYGWDAHIICNCGVDCGHDHSQPHSYK